MYKYRLSLSAKEDLIRIHHYGMHLFGERQADKYFDTFFVYFDRIAANPFACEAVDYVRTGYRRCPCGSDAIYYRILGDEVEIMSIIGKQDLSRIKE